MSKKQNESRYRREIVFVQHFPLNVRRFVLGSEILGSQPWMMSSVVGALIQTRPTGESHIAVREDSPYFDFQPGKLALEYAEITNEAQITFLPAERFDEFVCTYTAGVSNLPALQKVIPSIEKHIPAFRFMPLHLQYLIDPEQNSDFVVYKHLPRMFLRYDLSAFEALVWLDRAQGQVSPRQFPKWHINPESVLHVGGAWYAFQSLEEAIGVKFMAPKSEIHRIRDDL